MRRSGRPGSDWQAGGKHLLGQLAGACRIELALQGYFQQRYKTRHRLWTWPAALIMKTVIGTAVSDDAFSVKVVDAITSGDGKVRAYESHFFVVNSTDDR